MKPISFCLKKVVLLSLEKRFGIFVVKKSGLSIISCKLNEAHSESRLKWKWQPGLMPGASSFTISSNILQTLSWSVTFYNSRKKNGPEFILERQPWREKWRRNLAGISSLCPSSSQQMSSLQVCFHFRYMLVELLITKYRTS